MNLLFLKKRANKYYILCIILAISNLSFANDSIPTIEFLEQCKKSDAYYKHSYTDVTYTKSWSRYKKQISVNTKLVINNTSGVDEFAFLNLTEFMSDNLKAINVKTLKADGSIVELDSSLVFKRNSKNKKFGAINYPIPGVEPGDTIVTSYMYTQYLKKYELKDFVNLYSNVPSFNTQYTVRTDPGIYMRYKPYNNFPEPQVILNDTLFYCVFKMEKVKGISENENRCLPCDLPYVYYSLDKDKNKIRTWKEVYNQEFNIITQPISFDTENSSFYRRWKKRVLGHAKDSTKYYQFELLHADIIENMQMEPAKEAEILKNSGYFLKEKRFNPFSIKRLYRRLLEDLEIEYSAVFARSKRTGKIDPYNIRMGEFDHVFFTYDNGQGALNLLYPHEAYFKYQINEIPTSIYNTEAVITKPYLTKKIKKSDKFIGYDLKLAEVDSVIVNIIKLPGMSAQRNFIRQIFYNEVNLKEKNATFKYKFNASGGLSTDLRTFFDMLNENKEANDFYDALSEYEGNDTGIQIDTVISTKLKNTSPFNYYINAEGTLKDALIFLNDSIASISLDKLIQHTKIESETDDDNLNYYLDYGYTDYLMFILEFPCTIEILGFDDSNINFKNDYGAYQFELNVTKNKKTNNNLTIISNYSILKDMIPKDGQAHLKALNKLVKDIKNKRLLVKLKNVVD
ncbi:DUF3857 domain-containing protein [Aureibaculum luteum]|uniref:DUF3857 domain-containing protein n=1 Tax=Aureibaculum luteum TaxID=1548456 RepID=UPI000E4997DC|nr:DUF3857 domain-containing protein [Aureibaculum luteum]